MRAEIAELERQIVRHREDMRLFGIKGLPRDPEAMKFLIGLLEADISQEEKRERHLRWWLEHPLAPEDLEDLQKFLRLSELELRDVEAAHDRAARVRDTKPQPRRACKAAWAAARITCRRSCDSRSRGGAARRSPTSSSYRCAK
jgi:hypothetical protein